jgi:iron complex outermembrane receptor protein
MRCFLLILLSLAIVWSTAAQVDTGYVLPDVVIKENRLEMPFSDVSRTVNVMTARQIKALPVQSVNELLLYVAGVDVRQRGAHGVQADVSIRGGTFDQTLVLINGVKLSDPQTGHHVMNLPIDLENIERIEVLKGPGARIYGQNAFSGAINIVTKTPEEEYFKVAAQAGENTLGGVQFSAAFLDGDLSQYVSFSKDFSEGYRYNTDYDITNVFYQNGYEKGAHKLSFMAGYTDRRFGANGFYASPEARDQYEEVQTSIAALNYQYESGAWSINPRLYWRRNQDEYIFVRRNPSIYRNMHIGNTVGVEVHASHENALGTTGIGVEAASVNLRSNILGNRERLQASLFLEHRFQLMDGMLDLTPGLSVNHFSDFDTKVFPGLDVGVRLNEQLKLFANAGYTYRVPTFTDLYYEDPINLGNPNLQPEQAFSYEAGAKWTMAGANVQASYFYRRGFDLIDWTREADTLQWKPFNLSELDVQGLELNGELYFPVLHNANTVVQRLRLGYTYIDAELLNSEGVTSRYVLENLDHQFVAGLEYRIGQRFFHSVMFRYTSRVSMEDYQLVDTKLQYRNGAVEAFLEASNLLDTRYRETNLVVMPGRWVRAGVSYTFRKKQ